MQKLSIGLLVNNYTINCNVLLNKMKGPHNPIELEDLKNETIDDI
jgi:hypothetical protein